MVHAIKSFNTTLINKKIIRCTIQKHNSENVKHAIAKKEA